MDLKAVRHPINALSETVVTSRMFTRAPTMRHFVVVDKGIGRRGYLRGKAETDVLGAGAMDGKNESSRRQGIG